MDEAGPASSLLGLRIRIKTTLFRVENVRSVLLIDGLNGCSGCIMRCILKLCRDGS